MNPMRFYQTMCHLALLTLYLILFLKETTVSVIVCVPLRSLFSNFYQFKLILTFLLAPV